MNKKLDAEPPIGLSERFGRGCLFAAPCPSREVLNHVSSRWGVLILIALRSGTHRFGELRRKIGGVSEKMLAQSLQALARDGFVSRVSHPVVPPFVEYSLTPMGEEVAGKVADLADWIELNLLRVMEARSSAQADPTATEGVTR
ncbi:winged helix-turn-helix transcriptional regulator [Microbulbifer rhizosphaerae]|uniref:DNA-binding HxlR family transcriptional regulator n=1 Tax=Microbulbifer rhizosphaerae TaxID=1562603 RepID=A0A7W4Z8G9_9GAMM|nr:helix-turn-helix domain-containing protein [Microbulbifer rhizosphaerae]MBB3059204.1 DNA-binding HxlR family transcriptional regulator [Microbulbifer rhizosphaerae]